MIHEYSLRENFAEYHVEHCAAGKTETQRKAQSAQLADYKAEKCADNGGYAGPKASPV